MRRVVIRATLAAFLLPWSASAQTLSLSEREALARLSPESPRAEFEVGMSSVNTASLNTNHASIVVPARGCAAIASSMP